MSLPRCAAAWLAALALGAPAAAEAPFVLGGDPRVDPAAFRITTFANVDFPFGLARLRDGSLLVGSTDPGPAGGSYFAGDGQVLRFVDADQDGVADAPGTPLASGLPGFVTGLSSVGTLVVVATARGGDATLRVFRRGADYGDPLTPAGELVLDFPAGWDHASTGATLRRQPGTKDRFELYFSVGSQDNFTASTDPVALGGLLSDTLVADSVYRVLLDAGAEPLAASGLERIAGGLRNAPGIAFDPWTGDLYLAENGIDGLSDRNEPLSADELDRIPAAELGGAVEDFGFPSRYVEYRTGTQVGSGGIDPLVAFQPVPPPDGDESEGPVRLAFAPPDFPPGLREGLFVTFHGRFADGGLDNEENPLVYVDLATGAHFHWIGVEEPAVGHLDTLLADRDTLFVADLSSTGALSGSQTGVVYQIQTLEGSCDNGLDDDGDGATDAEDGGCAGPEDLSERGFLRNCDDGIDGDGDGAVDFPADSGCSSPDDTSEQTGCGLGAELVLGLLWPGRRRAREARR